MRGSDADRKHISPPWLSSAAPPGHAIYLLISELQRTLSGQWETEAGLWEWGAYLSLISGLPWLPETVLDSLFPRLSVSPWQCAPGLVGPPVHSPVPLLVKAPYEAPYQFPSRLKAAAPCAHPESLIGMLLESRHFNEVQSLHCSPS